MRIHSIYLMIEDGRCIFNKYFTPEAPPKNLVTGMLTALQSFVVELTGSYPTILASGGGLTFYFEKRGPLTVVLSTSTNNPQKRELSEIALKFLQRYGDKIDSWKGDIKYFDDFEDDLERILGKQQTVKRIDPVDPLNAHKLLELKPELQQLAKELIIRKEISSHELTDITNKNEYQTRLLLEKLVDLGHIGRYKSEGKFIYFTR